MKTSKIAVVLSIIVFLFIVIAGILAFLNSPPPAFKSGVRFRVEKGETALAVGNRLEESGLIRNSGFFYFLVRLSGKNVKAGNYFFKTPVPAKEVFTVLTEGLQEIVTVTIPEGLTARKTALILKENEVISDTEEFYECIKDSDFLKGLGIPMDSAEGFLFPETYNFYKFMDSYDVVSMMVGEFFNVLNEIDSSVAGNADKLKETVILASIIEREYQIPEEAPVISGVFHNRLEINMRLQSCATVEYIITEIFNKPHPNFLTYDDIEIDNPYNTYVNWGLPPGPVSNPGKIALSAALNPDDNDFLYFRLVDVDTGRHHFSKSLTEHNNASEEFYRSVKK